MCLSAEHATSLPITWSTVHVAFDHSKLHARQIAMLHTAAGGVGLVSLEYARLCGVAPHATAGGMTKHSIIRQLDQPLGVHSSRVGAAFAFGASRLTYGKRWHHVLNSLSADLTSASFSMLGEGSAFMEIGKRGVWSQERAATACEAGIQLGVLAIDDELSSKPAWMQRQLTILAARSVKGMLHPLPLAVFDGWRSYEAAFRLLQSGSNVGKVVLRIPRTQSNWLAPQSTQLITGGTGGLGLLTANWLATTHGASSILLVSRSGVVPRGAVMPTNARTERCDVAELADCRQLMLSPQRQLGGIYHAAGVLSDALIAKQTEVMLRRVFAPRLTLRLYFKKRAYRIVLIHASSSRRSPHCTTALLRQTTRLQTDLSMRSPTIV